LDPGTLRVLLIALLAIVGIAASTDQAEARRCRNGNWKVVRFHEDSQRKNIQLSFTFRKFFDKRLKKKLKSGISRHIYLEATVFAERGNRRIKTIVRDCRVSYDVWAGTYRIAVRDSWGAHFYRENSLRKALRRIANVTLLVGAMKRFPVKMKFFLEIRILFAPMPKSLAARIRRWIMNQGKSRIIRGGSPIAPAVVIRVHSRISRALKRVKYCTQSTWNAGP
jgi:Domain of unknown function (DUF4390)